MPMAVNLHNPVTSTSSAAAAAAPVVTVKHTVVFTTPANYATRLSPLLSLKGYNPIWCPTIATEPTPSGVASLTRHLSPPSVSLLSAIAFPSRTAIAATAAALATLQKPILASICDSDTFILAALGRDAELIDRTFVSQFFTDVNRVDLIVPSIATPSGLVDALGSGRGRRVLCPVPAVVGLNEPPVVPKFLRDLETAGWVPVRVHAYETRWMGPTCAEAMLAAVDDVDAVVFTSSGEVEGLLKALRANGWDWATVRRRWPRLVVAAHGPVTAAGAERLGVGVDVVSSKFGSFEGVIDALHLRLRS